MLRQESSVFFGGNMRAFKYAISRFCNASKPLVVCGFCIGALGGASVVLAADAGDVFNHVYRQAGSPGYDVYGPASAGRALVATGATVAADGSSSIRIARPFTSVNPSGKSVQMLYKSAASAGAVAAGIYGAVKILTPLGMAALTASSIYDLAKELSFNFGQDVDGNVIVTTNKAGICTVAPCTGYKWPNVVTFSPDIPTAARESCSKYLSQSGNVLQPGYPVKSANVNGTWGGAGWICRPSMSILDNQVQSGSIPAVTNPPQDASSMEGLRDAIAAKSGWPSTSKIVQATIDAARITGKPPEEIPANNPDGSTNTSPNAPSVTGPVSSPGNTSVSDKTNPDGSTEKTTATTTHNHNYEGAKVTTSNITNTSVQSCLGGSCNTSTTVKTETPIKETQTDCEKNPDAIGCQSLDDVPKDEVPKKEVTVSWAEESLGLGSGTCPGPWSFQTSNGNYALDISQYCSTLTNYVKPVVLVMALLAAFFIVAPIKSGV